MHWLDVQRIAETLTDIHSDIEGNVYSMNIDAARITKHIRDPETGRQAQG